MRAGGLSRLGSPEATLPPPTFPGVEKHVCVGGDGAFYTGLNAKGKVVGFKLFPSSASHDVDCAYASEVRAYLAFEKQRKQDPNADHVVRLLDYGGRGETPFLELEYAPGGTLEDHMQRGGLAPLQACIWISQAARGLEFVHKCEHIHRDVTPKNIVFGRDGRLKILDFGRSVVNRNSVCSSPQDADNRGLQSRDYAGPWLDPSASGDVFSLVAILYHCLTGNLVPREPTSPSEPFLPDKWEFGLSLPPHLVAFCARCLTIPEDRQPASVVASRLERIISDWKTYAPAQPQAMRMAPGRQARIPETTHAIQSWALPPRSRWLVGVLTVAAVGILLALVAIIPIMIQPTPTVRGTVVTPPLSIRETEVTPKVVPEKSDPSPPPQRPKARPTPLEFPPDAVAAHQAQEAWLEFLGPEVAAPLALGDGVTLDLVLIPPGKFLMGSNNGIQPDEKKPHTVTLTAPFALGRTEVTVGQFRRFVKEAPYRTEAEKKPNAWKTWETPGHVQPQTDSHPVVCVSWNDAFEFCKWLKKTTGQDVDLPSEAEWEYSCRAGKASEFHFGDDATQIGKYAWYNKNTQDRGPGPCGIKPPNAWGLYDMHGNVAEWCRDSKRFYHGDVTDPNEQVGPARVFRGGSFISDPTDCRSAARDALNIAEQTDYIGFRVCVRWKVPSEPSDAR
jgi:formylglycine-generating enzyme required for sulfatase activity/serine/threonine protein kinase